jgi:hypothetical protein
MNPRRFERETIFSSVFCWLFAMAVLCCEEKQTRESGIRAWCTILQNYAWMTKR